jgi:murein L,D-transpeptidase YcbB/YkuD
VNEIKNTIESNQDITDTIKLFYTETLYEPYWQNNKSKINDLLNILSNSYKEGIPTNRYEIQKINNLNFSENESDIAKLDIILTKNFLLHAKDLSKGIVNPLKLSSFIDIKRDDTKKEDFLSNLTEEINIKEYFESIRPKSSDYLKLMIELANLKVLKNRNADQTIVPNDITLEVGMSHPNIIPLRKRLLELNILENSSISETFDEELLKSVLFFQESSGLVSDGVIGKKNISSLKSINRNQISSSFG